SHAALQLTLRSLIMRGLSLAGTIILARLLAPSDFGVYGIVAFVIAIWSAIGDFGLGAALVQQADEPTPSQLRTVWTIQQLIALSAVVVVWVLAPVATGLFDGLPTATSLMLRVLSLGLVLSSLRSLPAVMMERELRFGPLATAEVLQQLSFYVVAIWLAAAGGGAWAFVIGGLGQLAMGAVVVNLAWRRRPSVGIDRACLRSLFGFGFAYQGSIVILTVRDAPLPALVGLVSGTATAGLTQFAVRVAMTISTIDEMVARIAFPAFARLQSQPDKQVRALDTAILMTALILVPAQCWIAAVAPVVVPLVFGSQWSDAVVPLQFICLATLLRFPARYLRQAEFAAGASGRGLGMSIATTILALVAFELGLLGWGLPGAAAGFLLGTALGLGASIWLARDISGLSWRHFWLLICSGVVAGAGALAALRMTTQWLVTDPPQAHSSITEVAAAGVATILFGVVYLALLVITNRSTLQIGRRLALRSIARPS
ncbi:MAG TPA: oligosaccharide flippase family protein, partial [Candidatus Limnocylindrales bacterium]